jgi:hypothetical protein
VLRAAVQSDVCCRLWSGSLSFDYFCGGGGALPLSLHVTSLAAETVNYDNCIAAISIVYGIDSRASISGPVRRRSLAMQENAEANAAYPNIKRPRTQVNIRKEQAHNRGNAM